MASLRVQPRQTPGSRADTAVEIEVDDELADFTGDYSLSRLTHTCTFRLDQLEPVRSSNRSCG